MSQYYIKKYWEIPTEQPSGRDFSGGLFTPRLEPFQTLSLDITDEEYFRLLSSVSLGAKIIYPDEYGALVDVVLKAAENTQNYVSDGTYYRMDAPFIKWFPDTPFLKDSNLTQGQLFPAWWVYSLEYPEWLTDFFSWFGIEWDSLLGYQPGDAISAIFNMRVGNLTSVIGDWLFGGSPNLPYVGFEIHVNGSGTLGLEVLNVPLGGRVLWQIDEPITLPPISGFQAIFDADDDLLETNLDILSLPPEQDVEDVEEITITGDGNHIVYVQLLPTVDDAAVPINYGAGFRSIRLGEGLKPVDPNTGEILDGLLTSTSDLGLITVTTQQLLDALTIHENNKANSWLSRPESLSGATSFTINADGSVDVTSGGGSTGDTSNIPIARQSSFSMNYVEARINEFVQDFEDFYSFVSPASATVMKDFLMSKYILFETNLDTAIADYIAHRDALNPAPLPVLAGIGNVFFCQGLSVALLNAWVIDNNQADVLLRLAMVRSLTDEQLQVWHDQSGIGVSDAYLGAPCYRQPVQTFEWSISQFGFIAPRRVLNGLDGILPLGNRILEVQTWGKWVTASGESYDLFYDNNGAGSILYDPAEWGTDNGSVKKLPDNQPQYIENPTESNPYNIILTQPNTLQRVNNTDTGVTGLDTATGTIHIKIIDRGAIP